MAAGDHGDGRVSAKKPVLLRARLGAEPADGLFRGGPGELGQYSAPDAVLQQCGGVDVEDLPQGLWEVFRDGWLGQVGCSGVKLA